MVGITFDLQQEGIGCRLQFELFQFGVCMLQSPVMDYLPVQGAETCFINIRDSRLWSYKEKQVLLNGYS